jgi:hypothetical protein
MISWNKMSIIGSKFTVPETGAFMLTDIGISYASSV